MDKKELDGTGPYSRHHVPVIWPDYTSYGMAKAIWDALEAKFGKVRGAQTYLQMVNMITIKIIDPENLLMQIQEFQGNCTQILSSGHSKFSEDLTMFTFCSALPLSYEETVCQYLDNITDISKYNLSDIIA